MNTQSTAPARSKLFRQITDRLGQSGKLVVLTGAGVSAESGIPTFRGDDGFWTMGSRNYRPEELATWSTFAADPELVWPWYLYRLGRCREALPNAGHHALVEMDKLLGDRFLLVTQNVDGLHRLAGSPDARTFHIHGDLERMRCGRDCTQRTWPVPDGLRTFQRGDSIEARDGEYLHCPDCGAVARPHVLWFDESYDETWFRFYSSMAAAKSADVLLIVGTSGATNLPTQMVALARQNGALIVELNLERSAFTAHAEDSGGGLLIGPAGDSLPALLDTLSAPPEAT